MRHDPVGWSAARMGCSTATRSARAARACLGFNPPFLVDNLLVANVFGPTAVASAAVFRLADGYPEGLLDPNNLSPFVYRRGQPSDQRSPYVQQFNFGIQRELAPDLLLDIAYVGNK